MSEGQTTDSPTQDESTPKPKRTPTMDGPLPSVKTIGSENQTAPDDNPNAVVNRFRDSGIAHAKYDGTRVRRIEPYQIAVYRNTLRAFGVRSIDQLDSLVDNEAAIVALSKLLGFCLVRAYRPSGTALLHRRGPAGAQQILKDVEPAEIISAIKTACELSKVFN